MLHALLAIAVWSLIARLALAAHLRIDVPPALWLLCLRCLRVGHRRFTATPTGGRLAWWLWRRWSMSIRFWMRWHTPRLYNTARRIKEWITRLR